MPVVIRPARTGDVLTIRGLIDTYAPDRRLLSKHTVTIYEDVQEFIVAEIDGQVIGCGALHVMWEDLGEVRTLAVKPEMQGKGIGSQILDALLGQAKSLGLRRLFCLTFETEFFGKAGFVAIEDAPVDASVYAELLLSGDEGVAEFLDLERVKPNTLGNTRMLLQL
ncbi:MAG: amino-acid N-acetyltransferase [Actinobacteria bacterium]|nr:amino-acid N-acetyltransferase [Actinomycetota bacterium]NBY15745.1 amino-acid N-acetyltransferase [Actinomycetota bacterium]